MKLCKYCQLEIPEKATVCGHCGKNQPSASKGCAVLLGILMSLFWLFLFFPLGVVFVICTLVIAFMPSRAS